MEQAGGSALDHHVSRHARLGTSVLINESWYYVLADSVRTDRPLFRCLHVADPRLIKLRAWSRLTEELREGRVRLSNRVHHQLWRYYPQMLNLAGDLAAT